MITEPILKEISKHYEKTTCNTVIQPYGNQYGHMAGISASITAIRPSVRPYGRNQGQHYGHTAISTAIWPESRPALRPYRQQYDNTTINTKFLIITTGQVLIESELENKKTQHCGYTLAILVCVRITTVHRSKSGLLCLVCASGEWNLFLLKIQGLHVSTEKCNLYKAAKYSYSTHTHTCAVETNSVFKIVRDTN